MKKLILVLLLVCLIKTFVFAQFYKTQPVVVANIDLGEPFGVLTYNGFQPSEDDFFTTIIFGHYFQDKLDPSENLILPSYSSITNNTELSELIKTFMRKNKLTFCETRYANDFGGFTYVINYSFDNYKTFGFISIDSHGYGSSITHEIGSMLIMGWKFDDNDTSMQTNIAIDAIIMYVEAAKYQMSSELTSRYPRIELYKLNDSYDDTVYPQGGVFIYINSKDRYDYLNRYIEIVFYILKNGQQEKYKLVLNYNNYSWLKNNNEENLWTLVMSDQSAYDFFIFEIKKLRR
jgi:hypothetical protein